jgi:hypothetical protein
MDQLRKDARESRADPEPASVRSQLKETMSRVRPYFTVPSAARFSSARAPARMLGRP